MDLSKERATLILKLYYQAQSPVTVTRILTRDFPKEKRVTKQQILRIVKKFEQTGSIQDQSR
jgi:hypothetical protein